MTANAASDIPRAYNAADVAPRIYQNWMDRGYFTAVVDPNKKPYCIIMPPPNVTGELHLGHALTAAIEDAGAEFVCLAGFMRILSDPFIDRWRDRLINIHPSLLPAFKGLHVHQRVIEQGERFSGCTVHFVRPEMDTGPIIIQARVPVLPGDDADTLAARVLEQEHIIYPRALRIIAEGRETVEGERALIDGAAVDAPDHPEEG